MNEIEDTGLRPKILSAARLLLLEDGIQGLSMRKIAAEIGCKAPSIYYHFANKDDLIHALIDEGYNRFYEHLSHAQMGLSHPLEKLETNLRAYIDFGTENPEYYEIMYLLHTEKLKRFPKDRYRKTRRLLTLGSDILRECIDGGYVRNVTDPELTTTTVGAMLHGYLTIVRYNRLDARIDRQQMLEELIQGVLRSVGAQDRDAADLPVQ